MLWSFERWQNQHPIVYHNNRFTITTFGLQDCPICHVTHTVWHFQTKKGNPRKLDFFCLSRIFAFSYFLLFVFFTSLFFCCFVFLCSAEKSRFETKPRFTLSSSIIYICTKICFSFMECSKNDAQQMVFFLLVLKAQTTCLPNRVVRPCYSWQSEAKAAPTTTQITTTDTTTSIKTASTNKITTTSTPPPPPELNSETDYLPQMWLPTSVNEYILLVTFLKVKVFHISTESQHE